MKHNIYRSAAVTPHTRQRGVVSTRLGGKREVTEIFLPKLGWLVWYYLAVLPTTPYCRCLMTKVRVNLNFVN